jgi:integrase
MPAAGWRSAELGNAARWDGSLRELLGAKSAALRVKRERENKSEHFVAIPYRDVPRFMAQLRARRGLTARALELCVLCASRSNEILTAEWREIDLVEKTWSIPAHKMKMGKPHKIPLSDRAVEILRGLKRDGERVFPIASNSMRACLHAVWEANATVHGFRSGFVDFSHEMSRHPAVVIDAALAHAIPDRVERAYRRGDLFEKRKQLMQQWSDYCSSPPREEKSATVTPIRKPRAKVTP